MTNYVFSKHALEKIEERGIPMHVVLAIMNNLENVIVEEEMVVHQAIVNFEGEGEYLVRVFVNTIKQPPLVITVYRTSKLEKYHESKIR
ncbi:MAG: hypothetical protein ABIN74_01910 [Ferruginibacter sp.]